MESFSSKFKSRIQIPLPLAKQTKKRIKIKRKAAVKPIMSVLLVSDFFGNVSLDLEHWPANPPHSL